MGGTLLLFGYDQLPVILAAEAAVKPFGATLQVVGPRSCGLTLGQLAAGVSAPPDAAPVALGGADGGAVRPGPPCGRLDPGSAEGRSPVSQGGADGNQPQLDAACPIGGASPGTCCSGTEEVRECGF